MTNVSKCMQYLLNTNLLLLCSLNKDAVPCSNTNFATASGGIRVSNIKLLPDFGLFASSPKGGRGIMRKLFTVILFIFCVTLTPPARSQSTITAASCNQTDVNKVINGPTHVAANGDTILIPAGSCTWAAGIVVPAGIGISIVGSGAPNTSPGTMGAGTVNTTIIDNFPSGNMFRMLPTFGSSLSRISTLNIQPRSGVTFLGGSVPISVAGTCAAGGCPNLRLDNLIIPEVWDNVGISGSTPAFITGVFGVADHNTVGDNLNGTNGVIGLTFMDIGHGSWRGVGGWGDNSWASPDTFGTNQAFYLENNIFTNANGTDTEEYGTNWGGARFVCRFNTFNSITQSGVCTAHGTDTTGRPRGVRQWEAYFNTGTCAVSIGCSSAWPGRSGTGRSFGNSFTNVSPGYMGGLSSLDAQRRWRGGSWGDCDGSSPWDTNDGITYFSGTIGSVTAVTTTFATDILTDFSSPGWTPNKWVVNGAPYSAHDVNVNGGADIVTNTSNTLAAKMVDQQFGTAYAAGHSYKILRATVCMDQSARGAGALLIDTAGGSHPVLQSTGSPGPVNEVLDPIYEADDSLPSTAGHTIGSNTLSMIPNRDFYVEAVNQVAQTSPTLPFNGEVSGQPISSWKCNYSTSSCIFNVPSTAGFEVGGYMNTAGTLVGVTYGHNTDGRYQITSLAGTQIIGTIQSPFTDSAGAGGAAYTVGTGHGTLANRPTTCTTGVGYWATDQGNWNASGVAGPRGYSNGQLYVCTATNTWTLSYTPYTYPHPLITGGTTETGGTPNPPTGVTVVVH